ncbi:MAG: ferrous iron transporter B [Phycisphaerales bacterium]|jgi:ferrous iron transport protein B|nr:ferrous iron transporter B [Phycisphaeraceae bacterium]
MSTSDAPTVSTPTLTPPTQGSSALPARVALLGIPNTGKTTLFNRLTGLRHRTGNFPGTTLEARVGRINIGGGTHANASLVDLPGTYSLEIDQLEADTCRRVLDGRLTEGGGAASAPDAVVVVLDATNLSRNLVLAGEVLRRRLPTVVALNMMDLARNQGLSINLDILRERLGCRVVAINARSGEGVDALLSALGQTLSDSAPPSRTPPGGRSVDDRALHTWAEELHEASASTTRPMPAPGSSATDKADRILTHPVLGLVAFVTIMAGLFMAIFSLATVPMDLIDGLFAHAGDLVGRVLPEGILHDLIVNGVVAGVGATVIFLPQICLLFFLISLLEDTGYLARAAFVMDRVLRPFGLPGHSFVPLLSSHACALPGIMAARGIPDRRERLATILVAPFMTCSARLPVYVLLTGLIFPHSPLGAALAFIGCYALGILAGVFSALIARRTILRGPTRPMALELPSYKFPSIRTAFITMYDRGLMFLKKAGTVILAICIVLWWLGAYPHVQPPAEVTALREQAAAVQTAQPEQAEELTLKADRMEHQHQAANSFLGHAGRIAQPIFAPLGFDWQVSIGVLASFAAREVFVGTMAVLIVGDELDAGEAAADQGVREQLASAQRADGTAVFSTPTAWSLLVFFVLAMQCLPTLVVTAREAGASKWAFVQLAWMSGVAYVAAFIAYTIASAMT